MKKHKIIMLPIIAVCLGLVIIEFILAPLILGCPRSAVLMGFIARTKNIDDVKINSMGFTGDVPAIAKKPGLIRILILGGSTMFNRNMTARLKNKLVEAADNPVEVVGAALRMHTSMSDIYKYRYLSKYHFDYVLIYAGINDLWLNHVSEKDFRDDYSHFNPNYRRGFFLTHSIILRILYNDFLYKRPGYVENGAKFRSVGIFENNLHTIIKLIKKDKGMPIIMSFAYAIPDNYNIDSFIYNTLGYNNPDNYDRCPVELWGPVDYVREGLERINDSIYRVARQEGVKLIDQRTLMGSNLHYFGDVCHLSNEGTDLFIDNIVNFFKIEHILGDKKNIHAI